MHELLKTKRHESGFKVNVCFELSTRYVWHFFKCRCLCVNHTTNSISHKILRFHRHTDTAVLEYPPWVRAQCNRVGIRITVYQLDIHA